MFSHRPSVIFTFLINLTAEEFTFGSLQEHNFMIHCLNIFLATQAHLKRQCFVFYVIGKELYNTFVIVFTWYFIYPQFFLISGNFSCFTMELMQREILHRFNIGGSSDR